MAEEMQQDLDKATVVTENYGEEQIQVLEGLEAVRKRPGMYIGSTDERGLHHLVYEIVDNAVDEALAGFCNEIIITLYKDGSCSVQDNGRGFPVGIHPKIGRPAVEVCLTILHADSMQHAVELARGAAKPGDVVSLSPASASFDLYPNFEVRGRDYKNIVKNLK